MNLSSYKPSVVKFNIPEDFLTCFDSAEIGATILDFSKIRSTTKKADPLGQPFSEQQMCSYRKRLTDGGDEQMHQVQSGQGRGEQKWLVRELLRSGYRKSELQQLLKRLETLYLK